MPAKSEAQQGFLGLVASGKKHAKGLSKKKAKEMLKGSKKSKLPKYAKKK